MMRRNILRLLIAALLVFSVGAQADTFQSAIGNLAGSGAYSTAAGIKSYRTSTLNGVSFGGANVRIHQSVVNLVNIDPPSYSAGCRGISMHLGGFSWISGDQLKTMFKQIAQAAPYVVLQMALSSLNARLSKLVGEVSDWMKDLSNMSLDSCQAAKSLTHGLVNGIVSGAKSGMKYAESSGGGTSANVAGAIGGGIAGAFQGLGTGGLTVTCSMLGTGLLSLGQDALTWNNHKAPDWIAAGEDVCANPDKAMESIVGAFKNSDDGANGGAARLSGSVGNKIWNGLSFGQLGANKLLASDPIADKLQDAGSKVDYVNKNVGTSGTKSLQPILGPLLLSWIGTTENTSASAKVLGQNVKAAANTKFPSLITSKELLAVLMCGLPSQYVAGAPSNPNISQDVANYCASALSVGAAAMANNASPVTVYQCTTQSCSASVSGAHNMETCRLGACKGAFHKAMIQFPGMMQVVANQLNDAVKRVAGTSTEGVCSYGTPCPLSKSQRYLIMMAPFPLWRGINMAAVAPGLAGALVARNAKVLSIMIVGGIIKHAAQTMMLHVARTNIPGGLAAAMSQAASKMRQQTSDLAFNELLRLNRVQANFMSTVKTVNTAVMKSSFASGITGADFARAMQ